MATLKIAIQSPKYQLDSLLERANGPSKSISPTARANEAVAKGLPNNCSTYNNSYLCCRITSMFFFKMSYLRF
jgi:hypothetical protein